MLYMGKIFNALTLLLLIKSISQLMVKREPEFKTSPNVIKKKLKVEIKVSLIWMWVCATMREDVDNKRCSCEPNPIIKLLIELLIQQ